MTRFMTQARRSYQTLCLIGLVTLVYGALLVMGASCALAHADQSQHEQHHHGEQESSAQNVLCAWACQATVDTTVVLGSPSSVLELVVGFSNLVSDPHIDSISSSVAHSRAPPSVSFVRLG